MKKPPARFLITDTKTLDPVEAVKKLPKNSGVILRDYDLSFDERFALGKELKKICKRKHHIFLVAKDEKLALALNADGMHFPEFAFVEMRRISAKKPNWFISASTHSRPAVKRAYDNGADAVFISPVFATASHPDKKPLGVARASHYIYGAILAYALGGVTTRNSKLLKMADFCGFAGISWVNNCGDSATVKPMKAIK